MKTGNKIRFVKSLSGRAIVAISILLTLISIVLSLYFTLRQKGYMEAELLRRSEALARNLAYNSQYYVFTDYRLDIQRLIYGVMNEEDIIYAFITDLSGEIIGHSDTLQIGKNINLADFNNDRLTEAIYNEKEISSTGEKIIEFVTPIEFIQESAHKDEEALFEERSSFFNNPDSSGIIPDEQVQLIGVVFLGVSTNNLDKSISNTQLYGFLITLGILIFGIAIIVILITKFVTHPLRKLMYATKIIASGNLDYHVKIGRSDEIGVLSGSFNHMTNELKKSREKVEEWNRILESRVIERTRELSKKNLELNKNSIQLQKAIEELKTLDKSKDDFLALVSHELRTPLSSIVAYSEVLLDDMAETREDEKKYIGIIKRESDRLTRLINDVLDLSKMEAGRMPFEFSSVKLSSLVRNSVDGLTGLANKNDHKIVNNIGKSDFSVYADPDKIMQVLSNLISNAIKYSDNGKTTSISAELKGDFVEVSVADNGKGIKSEDHDKVFDKFQQIENVDHHSEGTGLGMPISKIIVEHHGGKIWFNSTAGIGTTFYFTLPVPK